MGSADAAVIKILRDADVSLGVLIFALNNFRRLFAWLTFLLLGILIALGLAAQLNIGLKWDSSRLAHLTVARAGR
jgi:hypothetical protein